VSDHAAQLTADHSNRPERGPTGSMEVEAFIDFICPRCYIAVRYLSDALAMFEHRDDVRIAWRSFQLDVLSGRSFDELLALDVMRNHRMKRADATDVAVTVLTKLREAAARAGLVYEPGTTTPGNTFAAHRMLQLAAGHGTADLAVERMQRASFEQGMAIDDRESLALVVAEVGIDPDAARSVAFGDAYADAVFADRDRAERRGIWSVPFFICDDRFGVSGAQSPRWLHEMMRRCWTDRCRERS
jgi:predicted DsbA family dithiol-disulfide isomerase